MSLLNMDTVNISSEMKNWFQFVIRLKSFGNNSLVDCFKKSAGASGQRKGRAVLMFVMGQDGKCHVFYHCCFKSRLPQHVAYPGYMNLCILHFPAQMHAVRKEVLKEHDAKQIWKPE